MGNSMHEVKMPQLGQSVEEAAIVEWLKNEGDAVKEDEPLYTVQTDKAEIECESPFTGVLRKILIEPEVYVPVLTVVALIGGADEPLPDLSQYGREPGEVPAKPETLTAVKPGPVSAAPVEAAQTVGGAPVSPRARARAKELGVDPASIAGTGPGGRVIEEDVDAFAERAAAVRITPTARRMAEARGIDVSAIKGTGARGKITKADVEGAKAGPTAAPAGTVERIPLTPMRRIVAERMSESKYAAPHYYETIEVDMSAAKAFRAGFKGMKLSFNDFVLRAAVKALREFPNVNARWAGDAIEHVADINLGVAVALPEGLIVPVLKQAQNLPLEGLSAACSALVDKARAGKLLPDDYVGNTFTVSNLGPFGVDHFTAIINQPDSAILAVGQMKDRVVVVDGGIQIRPIMKITMSSDHRVVDGAVAAQFLACLKEILESADF